MGTGVVYGDLLFTTTRRLIVIRRISRPETPHLCILFKTQSGEIDLHFKYESARNDKASTYEPLIKCSESTVNQMIERRVQALKPELLGLLWKSLKRIRPGWLTKHRYLIALIDEEALKSSMYAVAPKRRGKHRVDIEKLKQLFVDMDPSLITLLEPSVLKTSEMRNYPRPFFAISARGRKRKITLSYMPWRTGKRTWVGLDGLSKELPQLVGIMIPAELREEVKRIWYRIFDALRLDELGVARE